MNGRRGERDRDRAANTGAERLRTIGLLGLLYLVQGMPFGFQSNALPVLLRSEGFSLTAIGWAGLLMLPWMTKALWAPLVDRYSGGRLGPRKSWIIPLQLALAVTCGIGAVAASDKQLVGLLALIFLMNLLAATQDIAVDGLAVDLLGLRDLGLGNAGQVIGFKLGMMVSGGLLVWATQWIGWSGLFAAMALLSALVSVLALLLIHEPKPELAPGSIARRDRLTFREIALRLKDAAATPGSALLILFIATYKLGESISDIMFKPFLVDAGFTAAQIGLWSGTLGAIASMLGSFAGGLLSWRTSLWNAVAITASLRLLPLFGRVWLSVRPPGAGEVIAITAAEELLGGALTACMFAFMMSRVDRRIAATHFTLLASVEVIGKSPANFAAGPVAEHLGYPAVFAVGAALSVAFLALLLPVRRTGFAPASAAGAPQQG